jgi:hypothetical protein
MGAGWRRWRLLVMAGVVGTLVSGTVAVARAWAELETGTATVESAYASRNGAALAAGLRQVATGADGLATTLRPIAILAGLTPWRRSLQSLDALLDGTVWAVEAGEPLAPALIAHRGFQGVPADRLALAMRLLARAGRALATVDIRALPATVAARAHPVVAMARQGAALWHVLGQGGGGPLLRALGLIGQSRLLVLYLDGGELRATGGFVAAVGTVVIRQGRIVDWTGVPVSRWQAEVRRRVRAPWLLRRYFHAAHLAPMNLTILASAPHVAALARAMAMSRPGARPLAGVVLVNSRLVPAVLRLTGPVTVQGVGRLTAGDALVTLERLAARPSLPPGQREAFLGPLAATLVHRLAALPASAWPRMFRLAITALSLRDLIVNVKNPTAERAIAAAGWTGALQAPRGTNHLLVLDQNLGGYKDNLFLKERIAVHLERAGRHVLEMVAVSFHMPVPANGWLTVGYRGWLEWWVPRGARLLRLAGSGVKLVRVVPRAAPGMTMFGASVYVPTAAPHHGRAGVGAVHVAFWLPRGLNPRALFLEAQPGVAVPVSVVVTGRVVWRGWLGGDRLVTWRR